MVGISVRAIANDIHYPNSFDGASYKNNGIQAQLLWDFDDSELDSKIIL